MRSKRADLPQHIHSIRKQFVSITNADVVISEINVIDLMPVLPVVGKHKMRKERKVVNTMKAKARRAIIAKLYAEDVERRDIWQRSACH